MFGFSSQQMRRSLMNLDRSREHVEQQMSLESNRESVKLATSTILATAMARNAMLLV
jgi:hypothetical protein